MPHTVFGIVLVVTILLTMHFRIVIALSILKTICGLPYRMAYIVIFNNLSGISNVALHVETIARNV